MSVSLLTTAIVLINNILPRTTKYQVDQGNYELTEVNGGISSIRFNETSVVTGYDPNRSNLPIGGFIVSISSEN